MGGNSFGWVIKAKSVATLMRWDSRKCFNMEVSIKPKAIILFGSSPVETTPGQKSFLGSVGLDKKSIDILCTTHNYWWSKKHHEIIIFGRWGHQWAEKAINHRRITLNSRQIKILCLCHFQTSSQNLCNAKELKQHVWEEEISSNKSWTLCSSRQGNNNNALQALRMVLLLILLPFFTCSRDTQKNWKQWTPKGFF